MSAPLSDYFASVYAESDDPYGLRARWYEQRKRQVLLSALPLPRYRSVYEPGCGAAELTVSLAERCDSLLASDFDDRACEAARRRTAHLPHVRVERHDLPQQWPVDGRFDLVVLSEIGYFLPGDALVKLARSLAKSLVSDGMVVSCDWKADFDQRQLATSDVHRVLEDTLDLPCVVQHEEADFALRVWARDGRSVAQREGWA